MKGKTNEKGGKIHVKEGKMYVNGGKMYEKKENASKEGKCMRKCKKRANPWKRGKIHEKMH